MDLSTRLSYLFGTEEYVGMRRQLVLLRETLLNHEEQDHERNIHTICSGSLGEGVAYPISDDDVMVYHKHIRVVKTNREATKATDLLMVPSEASPGYCRLLNAKGVYPSYLLQLIQEMPFLSSSLWKQHFSIGGHHIHGPCQSGTIGTIEFDRAICMPCFFWPDIANNWVKRHRSFDWPSYELIQSIISNGCHVVPVGDPDSHYCDHEWRVSFSVAERKLMYSFNHTQFLVYNLLRLTLKRVIEKPFPDVLCSYFMKTTLFFAAENIPIELWRVDNLESCFKSCLSALYDYIDHINFPNYFIPECNMIKRKINQINRHQILDIIRNVQTMGIVGVIHLSGESCCMDDSLSPIIIEQELDREFMFSNHFFLGFQCIEDLFHRNKECSISCLSTLWLVLDSKLTMMSSEIKHIIWNVGVNLHCLKLMNYLLTSTEMNKQSYQIHKTLGSLLKIGCRGDVTTGKLMSSTYMYMIGETKSVLIILQKLLSEYMYKPYVMDGSEDENKMKAYQDVMCGKGLTIESKRRYAFAPPFGLHYSLLNAFPSCVKIWISIAESVYFDPLSYAYFLQSLCHVRHQKHLLSMKSLRCLLNRSDDLKSYHNIAKSRMCVGIIKCVQGDSQSACRWLGSVYTMADSEELSRTAMTYIACLVNKKF